MPRAEGDRLPGPYRILLVEDALDQAHLIRFLLEEEGDARVTVIQDGLKGCRFARDREWDLVISDINLPGADGFQVMRASRESHPDTPILATTAYTNPEYANQALRSGADDLLQKPINRDDLLGKASALLNRGLVLDRWDGAVPPEEFSVRPEEAPGGEPGGAPGGESGGEPASGTSSPPAGVEGEGQGINRTEPPDTSLDPGDWSHPEPETKPRHVLAIGARPGDVEAGCGGTLLAHRARGDRVAILALVGREGATEERKAEAKRAGRRIGASLVTGNIAPDEGRAQAEMARLIENVVRELRPEIIYTHTPHDRNHEHRMTHLATLSAAEGVPNLYGFQSESSTVEFQPSVFIDVSNQIGEKLSVLSEFTFSDEEPRRVDSSLVDVTARYWGRFSGHSHAEPLELIRGPEPNGTRHRHPLVAEPSRGPEGRGR